MNREEALAIVTRSPAFSGPAEARCCHCAGAWGGHGPECLYQLAETLLRTGFSCLKDLENHRFQGGTVHPIYIHELDLSIRAGNALEAGGVKTVTDLVGKSADQLLCSKNFGRTSLKEVRVKLKALGLYLKGERP